MTVRAHDGGSTGTGTRRSARGWSRTRFHGTGRQARSRSNPLLGTVKAAAESLGKELVDDFFW